MEPNVSEELPARCDECGRERTPDEPDYSPVQLLTGSPLGWYSGDDGELCGIDLLALIEMANKR